uniref:Protein PHYTOCHROME KINASE SUBSTRATE 1-like n=1 Tax=Ananas comosus var. bracteatus TaxID=296719 RepID=A0A6V7QT05_ANACO
MASINPQDDSFNSYLTPIASNRRQADDGEIDIFGAEKYFSGVMDGELERAAAEKIRAKKATEEKAPSAKSKSGTKSTTSSEASFNSRSNLLRDRRRRDMTPPPPPPPDKPRGRKFLGVFRCSCSGRNAVEVEAECEKARIAEAKEQIVRELRVERLGLGLREEALSFPPNLNPVAGKVTVGSGFKNGEEEEDDDVRSESSSELFELESISTNTGRFTESAPTTAYEPSEASIEWSVVTASAANLSVASQSECHAGKGGESAAGRKGGSAHRPRLLMGCASHGAVNVATGTRRMPEKAASFEAGSATSPTMRYQMESLKKMEMGLARQHGGAAGHVAISRVQARPALYMR